MRDKRFAQRCSSEVGTVIPFVALGMTMLLLFLALALDQGVRYSGRTQLQQLVDASAQAALMAFAEPGAERADATAAARNVASMTGITQGFASSDLLVEYGRYDFEQNTFTRESMPIGPPQAVRVAANKMGENAFRSLLTGAPITANADSVAALRCRNVVFVQDVSSSFRDDIAKVQDALRKTLAILRLQDGFSSIETRVGLVAYRNIVVPAGTTSSLVAPNDPAISRAIEALDDDGVLCKGSVEQLSATQFRVPACVGSDMRAGLAEAEELLEPGRGKVESCEDLVLSISDGVPCKVTKENLEAGLSPFIAAIANVEFGPAPAGEPQGGGSTPRETIDFVNADMRESGSIAVLTANSDQPVRTSSGGAFSQAELDAFLKTCPTARNASTTEQQVNSDFAKSLITGFGQAFSSSRDADTMAKEMGAALQTIPPVVVQ